MGSRGVEGEVVRSYRDLLVWKEGMDLAVVCYAVTKAFPREEAYGMTSQIRRAAAAIPANIAEGRGREGSGEFVQFLRIAQGSLKESETHLLLASRVDLATEQEIAPILERCEALGKMLRALIRSIQNRQTNARNGTNKKPPTPNSQLPTPHPTKED